MLTSVVAFLCSEGMNWFLTLLAVAVASGLHALINYIANEVSSQDRTFHLGNLSFYSTSKTLIVRTLEKPFVASLGFHVDETNRQPKETDLEAVAGHGNVWWLLANPATVFEVTNSGRGQDDECNHCGLTEEKIERNKVTLSWDSGISLSISHEIQSEITCYKISWLVSGISLWPKDCFQLSSGHWYGGAEVYHQHWPMTDLTFPMQPYVSKDVVGHTAPVFGSFVERYFLNSKGISIIVHESTALWVSINENNDGRICFMARYHDREFPQTGRENLTLAYDICVAEDIKAVHQHSMKRYFSRPVSIPDERMIRYPIWSTWAKYKQDINEDSVLEFAKSILEHGFPNSQIEIDDKWSTFYGDLDFDSTKFPNPKRMIDTLHSMGFRVTLWTIPFASIDSKVVERILDYNFLRDGPAEGYSSNVSLFVTTPFSGETPALVKWWNGFGFLVDFTNPRAVQWHTERLTEFQEIFSVDSFKFDAGEAEYLPGASGTRACLSNSAMFSKFYAEFAASFGGMVEVRAGYRSQHLPIYTRMMDKDSNWSYKNGLKTLIPTCLTLGIAGYPFILPDMIGGNVYHEDPIPDPELFIRWLEVTAFMPSMQFSVSPWQYADDGAVVDVAKKYVELHASYVTPLILRFAHVATIEDGAPIVRPIWWVSPRDEIALTIDDEFLIGDEVLVAPILDKGAIKRDIYLPGPSNWKWKDERTDRVYNAGQWIKEIEIPLEEIAYFKVMKDDTNFGRS